MIACLATDPHNRIDVPGLYLRTRSGLYAEPVRFRTPGLAWLLCLVKRDRCASPVALLRSRNAPSVSVPPLPSGTSRSFGLVALSSAPAGKVPSDLISQLSSPPACTAPSFADRIAGCCPSGSPLPSLEGYGSMPSGPPASYPDWNRHLEAAFHSPKTTVRLRTAISRSKFPTYFFGALPSVSQARSVSDSPTRPGLPRNTQDRYQKPVA